MKSVVSERGQVTIPRELRERLGIRPGQVIEWKEEKGELVGVKVSQEPDEFESLRGLSDMKMTTAEFMEWVRGPREDLDH